MFGSRAQGTPQQGFGSAAQGRGFGQGAFGTAGAGPVKWGGDSKAQAPSAQPTAPGGTIFGQPAQRPRSTAEAGRGGGRTLSQGPQQGRGWQTSRTPPPGRGRGGLQQQQQPQQPRSPGVLQRLGSLVGSPWGKTQTQQQQQYPQSPNDAAVRAATAAAAALGGWPDKGRGRSSGRQQGGRGRQQQTQQWAAGTGRGQQQTQQWAAGTGRGQQQTQQWAAGTGKGQQPRNQSWARGQQQQPIGPRGWGSSTSSRGRGLGQGRGSSNSGSVFSRLGPLQDGKSPSAADGYGEEEMTPVDTVWQGGEGSAAMTDGEGNAWAVQEQDGWQDQEEDMVDMDADGYDEGYQNADGHEQVTEDDQTAADGDGAENGVMTAEEIAAAEQAALAAMPEFIGGRAGTSKAGTSKAGNNSPSPVAFTAVTPQRPATSYLKMAGGTTPGTPTLYDLLQPSPSRQDVYKRLAVAAEGGLNIDPQCNDMCPLAERDQRTADRQLHDFERTGADYGTDAQHAVKKYTRSEAGGLPDPSLLRTFEALQKTLLHLRGLMSRVGDGSAVTCSLIEAHRFLWDRYRSIRKDITQTELMHKGDNQLRWVIAANEEMARFMILADALLADKDKINFDVKRAKAGSAIEFDMDQFQADSEAAAAERVAAGIANFEPDPYDGHLNHQELSKTLLDLSALYREAHRIGVACPNEAEFLAYYLIVSRGTFGSFKQSTANFVRLLNQMTQDVAGSPYIQFALQLSGCLAATNYVGFIKLLEGAPLHLAAAGQIYVPRMRSIGLCCLLQSATMTSRRMRQVPLELFTKLLGFDSTQQALQFAFKHKSKCPDLTVHTDSNGDKMLEVPISSLPNLVVLKEPPRHCLPWVLNKTAGAGLGTLVSTPCPLPDTSSVRAATGPTWAAASTTSPMTSRQQIPKPAATVLQQQQQSAAALQPQKAAAAAKPIAAGQQQTGVVQFGGAPAAVPGQGFGWVSDNARGSVDHLPALMTPSQAAKSATAVFGSADVGKLAASSDLRLMQPPAAAATPPLHQLQQQWKTVQQQRPPPSQQQQAVRVAGLPGHMPMQQQQQQTPQVLVQQQQQQQQMALQQQQQAVQAAVAAERARAKAEKEQLEAENIRLAAKLRLIKQAEELRDKCDQAARSLWLWKWRDATTAAKQARISRERRAAALAAADAAVGRHGNKRSLAVAGADHWSAGLSDWERQVEKRIRGDIATYEEVLSDLSPCTQQIVNVISTALRKTAASGGSEQQPALAAGTEPLLLPRLQHNGSTADPHALFSLLDHRGEHREPIRCAAVPPHYKLLLVSGWRETDEDLRPPLYQRRMANWLRHKLSNYTPSSDITTAGSVSSAGNVAHGQQHGPGLAVVPISVEDQQPHQQQARSYAAVVCGRLAPSQQQHHELPHSTRHVLRYGSSSGEADQLLHVRAPSHANGLIVDVVDIVSSKLSAATTSRGSTTAPASVCGSSGVLLLVSGPDEAELTAAVKRLVPLLEVMPAAVPVPLAVLTCSDVSTKDDVTECLKGLISALPTHLVNNKLSTAEVFCAGPGADPREALAAAAAFAAQAAPQLPLLRCVSAADLLEALQVLHLTAAAADATAEGQHRDVLHTYVSAHNSAIADVQVILQEQLSSPAYQWGYPPGLGVTEEHSEQIRGVLQKLPALVLPYPPALQQQQTSGYRIGSWPGMLRADSDSEAMLLRLEAYLRHLEQLQEPIAAAAGTVYTLQRRHFDRLGNGVLSSFHSSKHQNQEQSAEQVITSAITHLLELLRGVKALLGRLLVDSATLQSVATTQQHLQEQRQLQYQQQQRHVQHWEPGPQRVLAVLQTAVAAAADQAAASRAACDHQQHIQGHCIHSVRPPGTASDASAASSRLTPVAGMTGPLSSANGVSSDHVLNAAPDGVSTAAGALQKSSWSEGLQQTEQQAVQIDTNMTSFWEEMGKFIPGPLFCVGQY